MSSYIVGVTGGIGSGKTTVTNAFAEFGIAVIDADVIARQVVEPASPALQEIRMHFGDQVIHSDGTLNRTALRKLIFADEREKDWLNQLLHPLIREGIKSGLKAASSEYCLLSAPLLLENKLTYLCDRVLVVDVSEATQVMRTMARDNSNKAQVNAIMQAQISRPERLAGADDIIDNDGPVANIMAQVQALHQRYLELANAVGQAPPDTKP